MSVAKIVDPTRLGSARCCRHCPTDTYHWYKWHFKIVGAPGINTVYSLWFIIWVGAQVLLAPHVLLAGWELSPLPQLQADPTALAAMHVAQLVL